VIDRFDYRLDVVARNTGAQTLNYEQVDVRDALQEITAGRGPDAVIDAVGLEAHHDNALLNSYDRVKQATRAESDRGQALRQAILSVRSGGVVSIVGVYGGFVDKFPIGSLMNRSLTVRTGQTHVHRYLKPLLEHIEQGRIDPSFIITHRAALSDAPAMYETFKHKTDDCLKVVLTP
jgi:threonine dehydrogenase-like Zn-dependent dehydrogenase